MSNITPAVSSVATVTFHGHDLITLQHEGETFAALRPIVDAIGLAWHGQFQRIKRDYVLKTCVRVMGTQMPGDDQRRELVCLPLKLLNGWLFGIDTARIKRPEVREAIIQYKRECYDVLHTYWTQGEAINPRLRPEKTRKVLPNGLSAEQQDSIKALVKARVEALPHDKQAKAAITLWSSIKSKYGVSYKELSPEQFSAALSLVARVPLTGEVLPAPEHAAPSGCADILHTLNMFGQASDYGSAPTVPFPDDLRAEVERKAWDMAREVYGLGTEFMQRTIAYNCEHGQPRRLNIERAREIVRETTLNTVIMPLTIERLRGIVATVQLLEESISHTRKVTEDTIERLFKRFSMTVDAAF